MDNGDAGKESAVAYFIYPCLWIAQERTGGGGHNTHAKAGVRPIDRGSGIIIHAEAGGRKPFPGEGLTQRGFPSAVDYQRKAA